MWVLLFISLAGTFPDGSVFPSVVATIETYKNLQDCEDARKHVTAEMDAAYPLKERNYHLECKEIRKVQT